MHYKKNRGKEAGFSLIELVIAMMILAMAVGGLTTMLTSGMYGIARAGQKSTDLHLSQSDVERKISEGTASVAPLTITFTDTTEIPVLGEFVNFNHGNVEINVFLPKR